ncbi:MAG: hypothetical protein JXP34_18880 [Planctomycetes bacterium]|nr:hypothetical protein [Planctomycetota bacterium]
MRPGAAAARVAAACLAAWLAPGCAGTPEAPPPRDFRTPATAEAIGPARGTDPVPAPVREEVLILPPIPVEEERPAGEGSAPQAKEEAEEGTRGEPGEPAPVAMEPPPPPPESEPAPPPRPLRDIPAGEIPAARFFEAIEALGGGSVQRLEPDLDEIPIRLKTGIPSDSQTVAQIELILRAHGIYLAFETDPAGKPVAYASRSRRPRLPSRLTADAIEIVAIRRQKPTDLVRRLAAKLAAEKDRPPVTATPSDRAGKIILRGPSAERVAEIAAWLRQADTPPSRTEGFGSYACEFTRAVDVAEAIVARLGDKQRERVRVIAHQESNTVVFRAPREWIEALAGAAKEIDRANAPPGTGR